LILSGSTLKVVGQIYFGSLFVSCYEARAKGCSQARAAPCSSPDPCFESADVQHNILTASLWKRQLLEYVGFSYDSAHERVNPSLSTANGVIAIGTVCETTLVPLY
jgi:hypothetical protein